VPIDNVFEIFSNVAEKHRDKPWLIAISGGKDSTTMTLLFLEWLSRGDNARKLEGTPIYVLYNDSGCEYPTSRRFVLETVSTYIFARLKELHIENVSLLHIYPLYNEMLWFLTFCRGYPAPTIKFRWCTYCMKVRPTERTIDKLRIIHRTDIVLISGVRKEESTLRSRIIDKMTLTSPAPYILDVNRKYIIKIAPLYNWSDLDVWTFLLHLTKERPELFKLVHNLYSIYGINQDSIDERQLLEKIANGHIARTGCWCCPLVRTQQLNLIYGSKDKIYLYLEAFRVLYRMVSDISDLRERKSWGYSRSAYLKISTRALLYFTLSYIDARFNRVEEHDNPLYMFNIHVRKPDLTFRDLFNKIYINRELNVLRELDEKAYLRTRDIVNIKLRDIEQIADKICSSIRDFVKKNVVYSTQLAQLVTELVHSALDHARELMK